MRLRWSGAGGRGAADRGGWQQRVQAGGGPGQANLTAGGGAQIAACRSSAAAARPLPGLTGPRQAQGQAQGSGRSALGCRAAAPAGGWAAAGLAGGAAPHLTPMRVANVSMPNCLSPSMSGKSLVMAITVAKRVTNAVMKLRGREQRAGSLGGGGGRTRAARHALRMCCWAPGCGGDAHTHTVKQHR